MKIRSRWLDVLGSSVLSLAVIACGDDGSGGTTADGGSDGGLDAGGGGGETADSSVAPDDTTDVTGSGSDSGAQTVDVTLDQSADSTDAGSADAADAALLDASSVTDGSSNEDSGTSDTTQDTVSTDETTTESDEDASADDTTITSEPIDTTDTGVTESDPPDATDETTTVQTDEPDAAVTDDTTTESSTEETVTSDTSVVTDEVDASVDGGDETTTAETTSETTNAPTSDIQTSDITTGASELYWPQSIWSGYVFPFGAGQVAIDNGTVCVSGNEVGTVGLLYNVNQPENGEPSAFVPDGNDAGIDLNIVSAIGGQVRFSAGGTEYCAQAVEGETFYFWFWDRFSDCATSTIEYDGQTPFEAIAIVLSAAGEYELCVDKFNVGELPEGGVLPVEAGVGFDASLLDPT